MKAEAVIKALNLIPLSVEGGFFHESYRSKLMVAPNRCCGTSIYYLLRTRDRSAWHKVSSDEIWYYHAGTPVRQLIIHPDGFLQDVLIGPPDVPGATPQSLIPAGCWQGALLWPQTPESPDWGLFGAAVFPGFEYADFTAADDAEIIGLFPLWEEEIHNFSVRRR